MTNPDIPTSQPPNQLSGHAIAEHLLLGGDYQVESPDPHEITTGEPAGTVETTEAESPEAKQKRERNERLRAERFGIQGALIDRFSESIVSTDTETGRPTFSAGISRRQLEQRAHKVVKLPDSSDPFTDLFDDNAVETWQLYPYGNPKGAFDDFQKDVNVSIDGSLEVWARQQLTNQTEAWKWAQRLVQVGERQTTLNVTESIIGGEVFTGDFFASKTPEDALVRLPVENIANVCGELAQVSLELLDDMGVNDEAERLHVLDDIILQTRDVSQHHIAHFSSGELDEVTDAPKLGKLHPALNQDETGRWHLDRDGRVKPRPKENILSRTQHCPAAYRVEGEPSAIERLGWAFNTELQKRGLLVPGAVGSPAPDFRLPGPVYKSAPLAKLG